MTTVIDVHTILFVQSPLLVWEYSKEQFYADSSYRS